MKPYAVGALLVFALSCRKEATPDLSPIQETGKILFLSRRMDNSADWQIMVMNADGSGQHLLSNSITDCSPAVLSHNGNWVAFTIYSTQGYELHVIDINGQSEKIVASSKQYCGSAAWSPDDTHLAFVRSDDITGNTYDICTVNKDSSNELTLTNGNINFSPQYFPDGKAIVYSYSNGTETGIYKMNTDGSNKQRLTPEGQSFGAPVVSPDGSQIAVTSIDRNGSQLFVMKSNGSHLTQITFTVSPGYWDTGFPRDGNYGPVWSPDGRQLLYTSYGNGSPDIFKINADGSGNKRLTDTPLRDEHPGWTKDGSYILFSSNRNMNVGWEIYIMKPDGQLQTPLTNWAGDDVYPQFISQ